MYTVKVFITLRESIIDPQGTALQNALQGAGFGEVEKVRVGKTVYLTVDKIDQIETRIEEMCKTLLVNAVMEDYTYEIQAV